VKEITSVTITHDKVTLVVVDRPYWGPARNRRQMTFRRPDFEKAMNAAQVTVPWQRVT
jgi:hypothetical protein